MSLKDHLTLWLHSYNPNLYDSLVTTSFRKLAWHATFMLLLALVAMLVLSIPALLLLPSSLESGLRSFDELSVDFNATAQNRIMFFSNPDIVVDLNGTHNNELLFFNDEGMHYNRFFYFGGEFIPESAFKNVQEDPAGLKGLLVFLALALLPSLYVLLFVYFALKYTLLVAVTSLLGLVVAQVVKYKIRFPHVVKISWLASIAVAVLEILLFPFWRSLWVFLVVQVLLLLLALLLVGERKLPKEPQPSAHSRR